MKSLQSKMILVMFLFILIVVIFSAFFSIVKIEQVYYRGFVEEMLNTISSFGLNVDPRVDYQQNSKRNLIQNDFIGNFSIYFSLNNIARFGSILDETFNVVYTNKTEQISDELFNRIKDLAETSPRDYELINDFNTNEYYFMYFVRDYPNSPTKYTLLIEQNKTYINNQLKEVVVIYIASIIVIAIMALVVSGLLAANVTKPIEVIRKKAQLIAARKRYSGNYFR